MANQSIGRRGVLRQVGVAGAGLMAASVVLGRQGLGAVSGPTPQQTEGPFYPIKDQLDKDADMTRVAGRDESAEGKSVLVRGVVVDVKTGLPLAGALVEFWQACATGRYNHPRDTNDAALDPNFQYWAQVQTNQKGEFSILGIRGCT